jgi:hypothetical protein
LSCGGRRAVIASGSADLSGVPGILDDCGLTALARGEARPFEPAFL